MPWRRPAASTGRATRDRTIAHIQLIHPDDRDRFAELGVAANAQAYWAASEDQMDLLTLPFIGPQRTAWTYPFGSLLRAGATLVMGSDWSVSTRRSAAPDGSGGHPRRRPEARPAAAVPARRADRAGGGPRGLHVGECLGEPPGRRGRDDRGRARPPTSSCSIATCSTVLRARSGRPVSSPRSSMAPRSSRGRISAAESTRGRRRGCRRVRPGRRACRCREACGRPGRALATSARR